MDMSLVCKWAQRRDEMRYAITPLAKNEIKNIAEQGFEANTNIRA